MYTFIYHRHPNLNTNYTIFIHLLLQTCRIRVVFSLYVVGGCCLVYTSILKSFEKLCGVLKSVLFLLRIRWFRVCFYRFILCEVFAINKNEKKKIKIK